jgi:hypothetical protein
MADVYVTFGKVGKRATNGVVSTFIGGTTRSEKITSSGSSAQGDLTATKDDYVKVSCASPIAIVAGPNPTATLATGIVASDGIPEYISVQAGDKIAVIDV